MKTQLKEVLLRSIASDPEKIVRTASSEIITLIAKTELPAMQWPELLPTLFGLCSDADPGRRAIGMQVLGSVVPAATTQLTEELTQIFGLFATILRDPELIVVRSCTRALVQLMHDFRRPRSRSTPDPVPLFQALLPLLLEVIQRCILAPGGSDEETLGDTVKVLEEAAESELPLLTGHVDSIVQAMLAVVANLSLDETARAKCIWPIDLLCKKKPKTIVKQRLLHPIMQCMVQALSEPSDDIDLDDKDDNYPQVASLDVIDSLTKRIPPEIIFPLLGAAIAPAVTDASPDRRRAGFMMLEKLGSGCGGYIGGTGHLPALLRATIAGLDDSIPMVRKAAFIALLSLVWGCQPDVVAFHADVLPRLLAAAADSDTPVELAVDTLGAIEEFLKSATDPACEIPGAEDAMQAYLPQLMERLTALVHRGPEVHSAVLSSIGILAKLANVAFAPYAETTMLHLKSVAVGFNPTDIERLDLFCQVIDTIGCLVQAMSDTTFVLGHMGDLMALSFRALEAVKDPDVRFVCFRLFASLAEGNGAATFLSFVPQVMTLVLASCTSEWGEIADIRAPLFDDSDDDDDEDPRSALGTEHGSNVQNSFVNEKETAINLLEFLAQEYGVAFAPHAASALGAILGCRRRGGQRSHLDIKVASANAVAGVTVCLFEATATIVSPIAELPPSRPLPDGTKEAITTSMAMLVGELIDESWVVATAGLQGLCLFLERIGPDAFGNLDQVAVLAATLLAFLRLEQPCQALLQDAMAEGPPKEGNDDDGEFEELRVQGMQLFEAVADVVVALAKSAGHHAVPMLRPILDTLSVYSRSHREVSERSSTIGCIAETVDALGNATTTLAEPLLPVVLASTSDSDPEVRSNAAYALGILCQNAPTTMEPHVPTIMVYLHKNCVLGGPTMTRAADNAVGAVSRLVLAMPQSLSLNQVIPSLVGALPLREDVEENPVAFRCIVTLSRHNFDLVKPQLSIFLTAVCELLSESFNIDDATRLLLREWLVWMVAEHNNDLLAANHEIPAAGQAILQAAIA